MSVFNTSIGFGAYANTGLGFDPMNMFGPSAEGCDVSRAGTCGTIAADGSSTCYDERGCPIYKEGITKDQGKLTVLSKKTTATGKQFLQDRVQAAKEAGEALDIDMFGKKISIPGAMSTEKKLAIGAVVLGAVLLIIFALKSQ